MRLTLITCLGLAACGGGGSSNGGADAEEMVDCSMVTGTDTFVVGLEKKGAMGAFDFKMMSATPAPPARNTNVWVVQVNAMQSGVVGSPVDGASIVATPFMPSHQHGSPQMVVVSPAGQPGQYTLNPVFLWMPGVWETTIQVTSGASTDSAVYRFCIPS